MKNKMGSISPTTTSSQEETETSGQSMEIIQTQAGVVTRISIPAGMPVMGIAARYLGLYYLQTNDYIKAAAWFQKGAVGDDDTSCYELGILWRDGMGTPEQDYHMAACYFFLATRITDDEDLRTKAQQCYDYCMKHIDSNVLLSPSAVTGAPVNLTIWKTLTELAEQLQDQSLELTQQVPQADSDGSLTLSLGDDNEVPPIPKYLLPPDLCGASGMLAIKQRQYDRAFHWFYMGARQGDDQCGYDLAICLRDGEGCEPNPTLAHMWLERAVEQGNSYAQNTLGHLYYDGIGGEQNKEKAIELFRLSAEQGNKLGQVSLGQALAKAGLFNEAKPWLEKAAEQGVDEANRILQQLNQT